MIDLSLFESISADSHSIARRKLQYGVGINDAPFVTNIKIDGKTKTHPAIKCWNHMLERCYSAKTQAKHPTYIGVTVCNEWHRFMRFYDFWIENYIDGYCLDKDILFDSKIYSPETCLFVPHWVNNMLLDPKNKREGVPIGANWHKRIGAYQVRVCNYKTGDRVHFGYFDNKEDANKEYVKQKLLILESLKTDLDDIDKRIYKRAVEIVGRM